MIFCDVLDTVDKEMYRIRISPYVGNAPLKREAGLYSMTCQGYYKSGTFFSKFGDQTRVKYSIKRNATLPVAFTLRYIPRALINSIAQNKLHQHIEEITDSFIKQSILTYSP